MSAALGGQCSHNQFRQRFACSLIQTAHSRQCATQCVRCVALDGKNFGASASPRTTPAQSHMHHAAPLHVTADLRRAARCAAGRRGVVRRRARAALHPHLHQHVPPGEMEHMAHYHTRHTIIHDAHHMWCTSYVHGIRCGGRIISSTPTPTHTTTRRTQTRHPASLTWKQGRHRCLC